MVDQKTLTIRKLNDQFRKSFAGGTVVHTQGVRAMSGNDFDDVVNQVKSFDKFTKGNDPYGDHSFGSIKIHDQNVFWKIDYYDQNLEFGSENPADPKVTHRVLTVMLAMEY